jgi:hypothetical protein
MGIGCSRSGFLRVARDLFEVGARVADTSDPMP